MRGMALEDWWARPLAAGAGVTVARAAPPKKETVSHSHLKTRTSERWMAGKPVRELQWPLRGTLESALEGSGHRSQAPEHFQGLTGWLVVSAAPQLLPVALRLCVRGDHDSTRGRSKITPDLSLRLLRKSASGAVHALHHC